MLRFAFTALAGLVLCGATSAAAQEMSVLRSSDEAGAPALGENFSVRMPTITMLWVAPGTFFMSSIHGAGDGTRVTLTRGFWLGQTEVTQAQWQAVLDTVPVPSLFKGSDRPVERILWDTVMRFLRKLDQRERAAGRIPAGYSYTLPTEAQWEYACRAGTTGIYAGELAAMAWYDGNSARQTHPVAKKQPNAWGFYDMHGNVSEWCLDWYSGYAGGTINDPVGTGDRQFHVARGGDWASPAGMCRSAFRAAYPDATSATYGFRLALTAETIPPATTNAADKSR
jgi:formylglycine-generating enzyme required for sulfatase activity